MEALYQAHREQGLMIITMLLENDDETPPNQAELQQWATQYGQTFPVLSDAEPVTNRFSARGGEVSLPSHTLLGPGGVVLIADGDATEADILAALP